MTGSCFVLTIYATYSRTVQNTDFLWISDLFDSQEKDQLLMDTLETIAKHRADKGREAAIRSGRTEGGYYGCVKYFTVPTNSTPSPSPSPAPCTHTSLWWRKLWKIWPRTSFGVHLLGFFRQGLRPPERDWRGPRERDWRGPRERLEILDEIDVINADVSLGGSESARCEAAGFAGYHTCWSDLF